MDTNTSYPNSKTSCPPHLFGRGMNREFGKNEHTYQAPNHKQLTWQLYDCFHKLTNNNIEKSPTFIQFEEKSIY